MIDWRCQSVVERPPAHPSCRPMQQAPGRLAIFTPGRSRLRMARTHIGNTCLYKGLGARDGSRDSPCVFFSGGRSTAQTTIRCGAITFVRFGTHDVGGKGEGGRWWSEYAAHFSFPPFSRSSMPGTLWTQHHAHDLARTGYQWHVTCLEERAAFSLGITDVTGRPKS